LLKTKGENREVSEEGMLEADSIDAYYESLQVRGLYPSDGAGGETNGNLSD